MAYSGGTGGQGDPYLLSSTDDILEWVANGISSVLHFKFTNDILFDIHYTNVYHFSSGAKDWNCHMDLNGYTLRYRSTDFLRLCNYFHGSLINGTVEIYGATANTRLLNAFSATAYTEDVAFTSFFESMTTSSSSEYLDSYTDASLGTHINVLHVIYDDNPANANPGLEWNDLVNTADWTGCYVVYHKAGGQPVNFNRTPPVAPGKLEFIDYFQTPGADQPSTYPALDATGKWVFTPGDAPTYAGNDSKALRVVKGVVKVADLPAKRSVSLFNTAFTKLQTTTSDPTTGEFRFQGFDLIHPVFVMVHDDHYLTVGENTIYQVGDFVSPPEPNGYVYECTTGGNTGTPLPPNPWPNVGSVVVGTCTFVPRQYFRAEIEGPIQAAEEV